MAASKGAMALAAVLTRKGSGTTNPAKGSGAAEEESPSRELRGVDVWAEALKTPTFWRGSISNV
jgi:hypothetical protein